jgi:hypothetical protein
MSRLISRRNDIKWGTSAIKGSGNPNFNGGKYIDDKGYIRILQPDHPASVKGYIYEHRLVMEAHLGRYLQSWETVHHINEVKIDNRIDNFFLTTFAEHSAIHRTGKNVSLERKAKLREQIRERRKEQGPRQRDSGGKFVKKEKSDDSAGIPETD